MRLSFAAVLSVCAAGVLAGGPFGLAKKPVLGWRSWNPFHANVNQDIMEAMMEAMVDRSRTVNGKPTSLLDLGYKSVGLDDNWQACGTGYKGSFHDADGNPLINTERFPDFKAMNAKAHALGLLSGWYMNNCICNENQFKDPDYIAKVYQQSVSGPNGIVTLGFDGVKLDGCSQFHNTTLWAQLLNDTGRPVLIENCHNSHPTYPTSANSTCPYNWYRSSTDINPSWGSIMNNLNSVPQYEEPGAPRSRPTCWAYPDMLEVGNLPTTLQSRSHFGAWAIVSSPLILGFNLSDSVKMDAVWDIISNTEVITVNQEWYGTAVLANTVYPPSPSPTFGTTVNGVKCNTSDARQTNWKYDAAKAAIVAPSGLCVDGSTASQLTLDTCSGSPSQNFTWSQAAKSPIVAPDGRCVDVYDFHGPAVQLYACNGGTNQEFSTGPNASIQDGSGMCLSAGDAADSAYQIWAKPQADGAVAVFVLNSESSGVATNVTVSFLEVGLRGGPYATVRDLYAHADLPDKCGSATGFTTDAFTDNDSRFYLLKPVASCT